MNITRRNLLTGLAALCGPIAVAQQSTTLRSPDVPYVPTPEEVVEAMLQLGEVKQGDVLYDLGSGDGRIVITAAKKFGVRGTGIDINPAGFLNTDRITTYVVDQGSRESLEAFLRDHPNPDFDIIIDDGSHRADHQQISLEVLFPHLKPGGLYFIEDLNDHGYGGKTSGPHATPATISTREFFKRYARKGEIADPNAFDSTDFLGEVADILFHKPKPLLRPRDLMVEIVRTVLGRASSGIMRLEWAPDSEMMVALQKIG